MSAPATPMQVGTTIMRQILAHGIGALASVHTPLEMILPLRKKLGPPGGPPFPASFLKPSDEQTIVAVAAVLEAIRHHRLDKVDFSDWGVVAAPRFLGRLYAAVTIDKFRQEGAWKAPPLFVPHRSLHAVSGTISQVLQIKGPNFGVGGGINAPIEGMLTALTVLKEIPLPGLWLVLTQCDPEPMPDGKGNPTNPVICHALALALQPHESVRHGLRLQLVSGSCVDGPRSTSGNSVKRSDILSDLIQFVQKGTSAKKFGVWSIPLNWGCLLQLTDE